MHTLTHLALAASVGIAPLTHAAWGFRYEFSTDNGTTFGSQRAINVSGGDVTLKARVVAYADLGTIVNATNGAGPAVAFARYGGSEKFFALNGASTGVAVLSQTRGDMSINGSSYLSTSFSGGIPIVGTTAVTSFAAQILPLGSLFPFVPSVGGTPQLEWVIRTVEIRVSRLGGARTISFVNNSRTTNTWYRDTLVNGTPDTNTGTPVGSASDVAGALTVVPAPSLGASVVVVATVALRRRRPEASRPIAR